LSSRDGAGATIESVLGQDYPNFNCIVVEDHPVAGFARAIASYRAQRPDRLHTLQCRSRHDGNSLNDAWRQATGHYVAIVCSGDSFRTNWLSVCVAAMEANPETIVGYPDWHATDGHGKFLQEVRATDYDFCRMVFDPRCMPGPGTLIRRSAISMPSLRSHSFRVADGCEIWLLLGLQGDFIHVPTTAVLRQGDMGGLRERVAEYRRSSNTLFSRAGLPKVVYNWRHIARLRVAFICAKMLASHSPWAAAWLTLATSPRLLTCFLSSPRASFRTFLQILAKHSRKLTRSGIPSPVRGWIGAVAERCVSARRKSAN
jgi:glycosyltransferase involved in cell wall biosynthesis